MKLTDIIEQRYSCRKYSDYVPTAEEITAVLDAARLAPSATNRQPWHFTVVTAGATEGRAAVLSAYAREWIASANTFIIVSGCPDGAWVRPYDGHCHCDIDIAIATEHMCLRATDMGLATCWICNFDPAILSGALPLPEGYKPMVILPLGKPEEGAVVPARTRKSLEEITTWL